MQKAPNEIKKMPSKIITRKHGLKNQYGFISAHQQQICDYNKELTHSWLKHPDIIYHTERYICAIREKDVRTRALIAKREQGGNPTYDRKC